MDHGGCILLVIFYAVPHSVTLVNYAAIMRLKIRNYAVLERQIFGNMRLLCGNSFVLLY